MNKKQKKCKKKNTNRHLNIFSKWKCEKDNNSSPFLKKIFLFSKETVMYAWGFYLNFTIRTPARISLCCTKKHYRKKFWILVIVRLPLPLRSVIYGCGMCVIFWSRKLSFSHFLGCYFCVWCCFYCWEMRWWQRRL